MLALAERRPRRGRHGAVTPGSRGGPRGVKVNPAAPGKPLRQGRRSSSCRDRLQVRCRGNAVAGIESHVSGTARAGYARRHSRPRASPRTWSTVRPERCCQLARSSRARPADNPPGTRGRDGSRTGSTWRTAAPPAWLPDVPLTRARHVVVCPPLSRFMSAISRRITAWTLRLPVPGGLPAPGRRFTTNRDDATPRVFPSRCRLLGAAPLRRGWKRPQRPELADCFSGVLPESNVRPRFRVSGTGTGTVRVRVEFQVSGATARARLLQ